MTLRNLEPISSTLLNCQNSAFIFAMGFEDRALAIPKEICASADITQLIAIRYSQAKGKNRESEVKQMFDSHHKDLSVLPYSSKSAHEFEYKIKGICRKSLANFSEIIVDISAMSKMLILVLIVVLLKERKNIRIVFSEAETYAPTNVEFNKVFQRSGSLLATFAGQPTLGISTILRSTCLSSSRMQGQPVCAVAFTSFNEELIRHSIGTLNPHRLVLINGVPPSTESHWRALATQRIHKKLIEEFSEDNPINPESQLLVRSTSTLDYQDTLKTLIEIRSKFNIYERLIYFATGSKMQTVALSLLKAAFDDVHIEYPTPDSYFFNEYSKGIGKQWQLLIDANTVIDLQKMEA
ncbi:hypothetical protein H8K35_17340 [Undibacterium sp. LX40W]|nr:hypothetical protein [Undibacterium sp. LX40W]MBC3893447.1 hypothetical protein [Undibacterium sp. LX40W]